MVWKTQTRPSTEHNLPSLPGYFSPHKVFTKAKKHVFDVFLIDNVVNIYHLQILNSEFNSAH
jgi:hypothetical protein